MIAMYGSVIALYIYIYIYTYHYLPRPIFVFQSKYSAHAGTLRKNKDCQLEIPPLSTEHHHLQKGDDPAMLDCWSVENLLAIFVFLKILYFGDPIPQPSSLRVFVVRKSH